MHEHAPQAARSQKPARSEKPARSSLGPGHRLDSSMQSLAESAYGTGLGHVTVHTGAEASAFAAAHGAAAATVGSQIVFADGSYQPGTLRGDALLAHELAHVVQQDAPTADAAVEAAPRKGPPHAEHEADRAAAGALFASGRHSAEIAGLGIAAPPEPPAKPRRGLGGRLQLALCSSEPDYASSAGGEAPTSTTPTYAGARPERIGPADLVQREFMGSGYHTTIDGDGDQSAELDLVFKGKNYDRFMSPDQVELTATRLGNTPDRGGPGTESHQALFDNRGHGPERGLQPKLTQRTNGRDPTRFEVTGGVYVPFATFEVYPPPLEGTRADYKMVYTRREYPGSPEITDPKTLSFSRDPADIYPVFVPLTPRRAGTIWVVDVIMGRFGDAYRFTFRKPDPAGAAVHMGVSPMAGGAALGGDLIDLQVSGKLDVRIARAAGPVLDLDLNGDGTADIRVWETMAPEADWGSSTAILDPERNRDLRLMVTSPDGATTFGYSSRQVRGGGYPASGTYIPREFEAVSAAATPEGLEEAARTPDLSSDMASLERQIKELRVEALPPDAVTAYDALVKAWLEAASASGPAGDAAKNLAAARAAAAFGAVWSRVTAPATTSGGTEVSVTSSNVYTGYSETAVAFGGGLKNAPTYDLLAAALTRNNRTQASKLMTVITGQVTRFAAWSLRKAGKDEKAERMETFAALHEHLDKLADKKDVKKATAIFHSAPDYVQKGVAPSVPLRLYYWREGDTWYLQDLTQPTREKSLGILEAHAGAEKEPPESLFAKLDDADRFPKGFIQYQLAGPDGRPGTVQTHADWHWYDVAQWISMAIAAIAIVAGIALSGGTAAPVLVPALWALSAAAGVVGTVGHMVHESGQGRLTGEVIVLDSLQIIGQVAGAAVSGAKAVQAFRLIGAAEAAAAAGKVVTAAEAAKLMPLSVGGLRALLTIQIAVDTCQVVFMGDALIKQLAEIDKSTMSDGDKLRAKIFAIGQFGVMAGLSYVSVKGNAAEIEQALASGGKVIQFGQQTLVPGLYSEAQYHDELQRLLRASPAWEKIKDTQIAGTKVVRVPPEEIGSSLGLARIEFVEGMPRIVIVDGAPKSALRQEVDHLEQLALVGKPGHELSAAERRIQQAAETLVTSTRDWAKLSDAQKFRAQRARLILEEDGQQRLLARLKADLDTGRPVDAHEIDNAFQDLNNLRQRSANLTWAEDRLKAGAPLEDIDKELAAAPSLFAKKTVASEPLDDVWRQLDEEAFLRAYKNRYPSTTLSDAELKLRHAMDKRLNPQTGRLVDVNKEVPDATATYKGPAETMPGHGPNRALPPDDAAEVDKLLAQRDAARKRRDDAAAKIPPDTEVRNRAQYDMNEASRLIGERSAAVWARRKYPGPPAPEPVYGGAGSRPGDFDQVWKCTEVVGGKPRTVWVVVEAKGGSSSLGSKRTAEGLRAEQGTRLYFDDTLNLMVKMGGDARAAATRVIDGRRAGDQVRYMHIEAPMSYKNEGGVVKSQLDDVRIREFDLTAPAAATATSSSSTAAP
jgi:hypothetical protein